ncbi:MAG TPA: molybdopterin-dependent oxidoreductase [Terriglobales bacterium]|nr:molybdopterin-dependent oxidoreductase [Terriglobales bacterium]
MRKSSRRRFLTAGLAAAAGASGLGVAASLANRYGLVPPDGGGLYGPGESLTYAAHRLLARHSLAREFPRSMISKAPFANSISPLNDTFKRMQGSDFVEWRLSVDGMVARPASYSLADLKSFPLRSQITEVVCEEGWSYIAEWVGTPLSEVLKDSGILPQAKYLVYFSIDPDWWESIDMVDALHPQSLLTWAMNDGDLPVAFGGPLRLRVPRQLGYKSVKFVNRLMLTNSAKGFVSAVDSKSPNYGYSWYAGI